MFKKNKNLMGAGRNCTAKQPPIRRDYHFFPTRRMFSWRNGSQRCSAKKRSLAIICLVVLSTLGAWGAVSANESAQESGWGVLSGVAELLGLTKGNPETTPAVPTPTPTIELAKEYIYAGSRMLAIEDYGLAPPSTPVIANLDVRSSTQIDVYWGQAPVGENVASYNLRINGSDVISGITYLSKAVTGLVANTTYTFEVQAVKASGARSGWSQPLSAATGAVVTMPMIAAVQPQSSTQLDIYWNQPPAGETVSSYNLRINGSQVVTGITYLSWAVRNLTPGTTYAFEVQAVNSANVTSAWSAPVSGTTAPPPNATTIGAVTTVSSSQLNIFWNASSSQSTASYNLRINGSQIITGITYLSYPVKNLSANTTYTFEVQVIDAAGGASAWSPSVSGTTSP